MLFGLGFVGIILPRKGVLRGVLFLANHLASTDNLISNYQEITNTG